jgi:uncharacterized protein (DUF433 family)
MQDIKTAMRSLLERITINPDQCGGRPCIRNMRICVTDILELYASGLTPAQILEEVPDLEPEDLKAALLYASRRLKELTPGGETAILSEPALRKEWLTSEEDNHWAHL